LDPQSTPSLLHQIIQLRFEEITGINNTISIYRHGIPIADEDLLYLMDGDELTIE